MALAAKSPGSPDLDSAETEGDVSTHLRWDKHTREHEKADAAPARALWRAVEPRRRATSWPPAPAGLRKWADSACHHMPAPPSYYQACAFLTGTLFMA